MLQPLKYSHKLQKAIESQMLRRLPHYAACNIDFVSNDYLGISKMPFSQGKSHYFSGLGSRLIAGNSMEAIKTEHFLAEVFQTEAALIFNSGYDANLGFFSTIPQKDEIVLYDQAIHASVRDGLRLSQASSFGFKHNNLDDLETKLKRFANKNIFVVVEGVYSMDGDQAPLTHIINLVAQYDAYLIVDEAHSLGVLGENGLGLSQQFCKHPNLLARIVTFGKAIGAHGAAVLADKSLCDYLIHACRSFIYTTALPSEVYSRIESCIAYLISNPDTRNQLEHKIDFFSTLFSSPKQHIQTIPMAGVQEIRTLTESAKLEKMALKGVWSPTVPEGNERLRISLHAFNSELEIKKLYHFLNEYGYE